MAKHQITTWGKTDLH